VGRLRRQKIEIPGVDFDKATRIDQLHQIPEDGSGLMEMAEEAKSFLVSRSWCKSFRGGYLFFGVPPVFAIFLMEIDPVGGAPPFLWVMVGDIPPAVATLENCPDPVSAVLAYVEELEDWAVAVESGNPLDDFMPMLRRGSWIQIEPNAASADLAYRRAKLMRSTIIPEMKRGLA
jgi:hypothetical protein